MGLGPALERDQPAAGDGEMGRGGGCRGVAVHGRGIAVTGWDLGLAGHRQPGEEPH